MSLLRSGGLAAALGLVGLLLPGHGHAQAQPAPQDDYVRLVVEPVIETPGDLQQDCRVVRRSSNPGLALPAMPRGGQVFGIVDVGWGRDGEAVSVPLKLFDLEFQPATGLGRAPRCRTSTDARTYRSPLFLRAQREDEPFTVSFRTAVTNRIDSATVGRWTQFLSRLTALEGPFALADAAGFSVDSAVREMIGEGEARASALTRNYSLNQAADSQPQTLLRYETRSGVISASARVRVETVASAFSGHASRGPGTYPDFGAIEPADLQQATIGGRDVRTLVNQRASQAWDRMAASTSLTEIERLCREVQDRLGDSGLSAADATAVSWIMLTNHPVPSIGDQLRASECLARRAPLLQRFGITVPRLLDPTAEAAIALLTGEDRLARFFALDPDAEASRPVYARLSRDLFQDSGTFSVTDPARSVIRRSAVTLSAFDAWDLYLRGPVRVSCLTITPAAGPGAPAGFHAIGELASGAEVTVSGSFARRPAGTSPKLDSIGIDVFRPAALEALTSRWGSQGVCEDGVRPVLLFGPPPAPVAEPPPEPAPDGNPSEAPTANQGVEPDPPQG